MIELEDGHVRIVLDREELPLVSGEGDADYACGSCEQVLAKQVWQWEIQNAVLRCPSCGSHNEVAK